VGGFHSTRSTCFQKLWNRANVGVFKGKSVGCGANAPSPKAPLTARRNQKGPFFRQPGSQLIFRPLQPGSDFLSGDREFRMITFVREHLHRYGNCVVADTEGPYEFTDGNNVSVDNANLGYVANRFSVFGDERQSDETFVYLRRCWDLLAGDLRGGWSCPN